MNIQPIVIVLSLAIISFVISMAWTPILTHYLYKYKCWKKKVRTVTVDGRAATFTAKIEENTNVKTPRMGGLIVWGTVVVIAGFFWLLAQWSDIEVLHRMNFVSRSQTWLPLFTLFTASVIGFIDDLYTIRESDKKGESKEKGGGLRFRHRFLLVSLIGLIGGSWMYFKLGWDAIHIPFGGDLFLGPLFIVLFILVVDMLFTGSVIDGIDGLSGGILSIVFSAFAILAYARGQYELAAFCAVIFGSLLTFLWFNIPPARFYLSETGIMGLTTTLAVVAFFLDSILLLPLFAFIIILEVVTNVIQLGSKKLRNGKKVFLAAPIHHHFQVKGWPSYKVTMRFWLISAIMAMGGLIIALMDLRLY